MAKAVVGIARTEESARSIVMALKDAGFPASEISVLFPDKEGTRDFAHEHQTTAPEGATTGAVAGGALGGVAGWLAGKPASFSAMTMLRADSSVFAIPTTALAIALLLPGQSDALTSS